MSSGSNWGIPLLTTLNYSDWMDNIEALLKKDGLWGRLSAPTPPASNEKAAGLVYLSVSPQLQGEGTRTVLSQCLMCLNQDSEAQCLLLDIMLSPA